MKISSYHRTTYTYDKTVPRLSQSLRLYPSICKNQSVINWVINVDKGKIKYLYTDSLGHQTYSLTNKNITGSQNIIAKGEVETKDFSGVLKGPKEKVNPECFVRYTNLTTPSVEVIDLCHGINRKNDQISLSHELNLIAANAIKYKSGATTFQTTAQKALIDGKGVCQDFAHILITLARYIGLPARYINGFLYDENSAVSSSHAWAEIYIDHLGWVGFDPTYKKCIDDNYIRICAGFNALDASTIKGTTTNYSGEENLSVKVEIAQS